MTIDAKVWAALHAAAARGDRETFDRLVDAVVAQRLRDQISREAVARRERAGDRAWIASCR